MEVVFWYEVGGNEREQISENGGRYKLRRNGRIGW